MIILSEDSTARRCLDLIERHAGRFMAMGGGGISAAYECQHKVTVEERAGFIRAAGEGKKLPEIAAQFGRSPQCIRQNLAKANIYITPRKFRRADFSPVAAQFSVTK